MDTHITFINNSNDANNSQVVIFQQNVARGVSALPVAWQVIHCMPGATYRFVVPVEGGITAADSYGNFTAMQPATAGHRFRVEEQTSGATLVDAGQGAARGEVHFLNGLKMGAVAASIYKDGKMLAIKTGIAPRQQAEFRFEPTIWVGQVDQVIEGESLDADIADALFTEISLEGVASAALVMTGGGTGANATPLTFTLENVVEG